MATSLLALYWRNLTGDYVVLAVFLVLVVMSIVSWTLFFYKLIQLGSVSRKEREFHTMIESGAPVRSILARRDHRLEVPFNVLLRFLIEEGVDSKDVVESSLLIARTFMERGLSLIATISTAAPFVGLLGTVWGIMKSFHSIGLQQEASLSVVAPGISEALVNTALGLFVAIPAVFFYNLLSRKVEVISDRFEAYAKVFMGRKKDER